jgi:hypothetical protein
MRPKDYLKKVNELLSQFIALTKEVEKDGTTTWTLWTDIPTIEYGDEIDSKFYYSERGFLDVTTSVDIECISYMDMKLWTVE